MDTSKMSKLEPLFDLKSLIEFAGCTTGTSNRRRWWSGFDIRYSPSRALAKRMSNPKLHQHPMFASGPMILTFANVAAEKGCEC